jgi:hypothetical protein
MDDLAKEVNEELLKKVNRYMSHLESARKSARKYYERNKDFIRAKNKQRYKTEEKVRNRMRERYHNKKMQKLEEKFDELQQEIGELDYHE